MLPSDVGVHSSVITLRFLQVLHLRRDWGFEPGRFPVCKVRPHGYLQQWQWWLVTAGHVGHVLTCPRQSANTASWHTGELFIDKYNINTTYKCLEEYRYIYLCHVCHVCHVPCPHGHVTRAMSRLVTSHQPQHKSLDVGRTWICK